MPASLIVRQFEMKIRTSGVAVNLKLVHVWFLLGTSITQTTSLASRYWMGYAWLEEE
jgi:hypothetical protein